MTQGLHNLSGSGRAIDVGRKLYPKDKLENRKKCLIKKLSYITIISLKLKIPEPARLS